MNSQQPVNRRQSSRLKSLLPFIVMGVILIAAVAAWILRMEKPPEGNLSGSTIVSEFSLIDENGRAVTSESFKGQWRLMYFGFTYCPDICPTDAAKIGQALRIFEEKHPKQAAKLQPLFVTVDPERDGQAEVKQFTDSFHPRLLGLTGTPENIESALKSFKIFAQKMPGTTPDSYTYDHQAIIYLIDPDGRPVEFVAGSTATPEGIAQMLERFLV